MNRLHTLPILAQLICSRLLQDVSGDTFKLVLAEVLRDVRQADKRYVKYEQCNKRTWQNRMLTRVDSSVDIG